MNADDAAKLIDLPGQLLDKVVEVLAKVGIELPALVLQLFLLVLVLLALFVAVRALRPDWRQAGAALLGAGAIGLIAIGIGIGILMQVALPSRLAGRVNANDLAGLQVELLDFRGQSVSTGGSVDTQTGEFFTYYSPAWNGRARTLRIRAAGCTAKDQPISRGQLRTESVWEFVCEKP
jgi:hypothetical protein